MELIVFLVVNILNVIGPFIAYFFRRARLNWILCQKKRLRRRVLKRDGDDIELVDEFEPQSQAEVEMTMIVQHMNDKDEEL